jgi:hypothetical protein
LMTNRWPSRFNGFSWWAKPLKRLEPALPAITRLKPDPNERADQLHQVANSVSRTTQPESPR